MRPRRAERVRAPRDDHGSRPTPAAPSPTSSPSTRRPARSMVGKALTTPQRPVARRHRRDRARSRDRRSRRCRDLLRARRHDRDQRHHRAQGRARRRWSRRAASATCSRSAAATVPTSTIFMPRRRSRSCRAHLRFEVAERVDAEGSVLRAARPRRSVTSSRSAIARAGVEAVAIVFLHAYANPAHEAAAAARSARAAARRRGHRKPRDIAPVARVRAHATPPSCRAYVQPIIGALPRQSRAARCADDGIGCPLLLHAVERRRGELRGGASERR